jgi:hypothetical protein
MFYNNEGDLGHAGDGKYGQVEVKVVFVITLSRTAATTATIVILATSPPSSP